MRIVILRNLSSGRGIGARAVEGLIAQLGGAGHAPVVHDVQRGLARDANLVAALREADALIVAGGDGTVHHAVPIAMELEVPILHYPTGTENLFAREFGLTRNPARVIAAIRRAKVRRVDVGVCSSRCFTLMGSIGFDACIVERVAATRTGGISRATYVRKGASEFLSPRFVPLTVTVDGRELTTGRPGMVVIANSRQYAARLDPARSASMTDGSLDVVFLPIASRLGILRRGIQVLTGAHLRDAAVLTARGSSITVMPETDVPLQLDGEYAGVQPGGTAMQFDVRPAALSVFDAG